MRTTIAALWLFFSVSLTFAQGEIRVDDEHMQIGDNAKSKLTYSIAAGAALVVDLSSYKFSLWPKEEPAPDFISVLYDENQYYIPLAKGQTRHLISRDTAQPRPGGPLFSGFKQGKKIVVAIGKRRYDSAKKEDVLRVHWLGMVEVK
jgi:hypothetical protein